MTVEIRVGPLRFVARLEHEKAPRSCAKFESMLPLMTQIIQARWSGEAAWIPFGELDLDLGYENHTSYPAPGHHFATIYEGAEHLGELGHLVLWKGAQEISFTQLAR